jgi:hypothetical protein
MAYIFQGQIPCIQNVSMSAPLSICTKGEQMIVVIFHVWRLWKIVQDEDNSFELSRSCNSSKWPENCDRGRTFRTRSKEAGEKKFLKTDKQK